MTTTSQPSPYPLSSRVTKARKSDKAGEEGMKPSYRKEKDNDYMILEAPGKPEGGEARRKSPAFESPAS